VWDETRLLIATKNHVLKLAPDAVGLRTYEVLVAADNNVTAMAVDVPGKTLYFATASPEGVHGLSVSSGSIFAVNIQNPGTPYDISMYFQATSRVRCLDAAYCT